MSRPEAEVYCTNCNVPQVPETEQPACPKCGGRTFKVRLAGWREPLTRNDKRFLRSLGIGTD